MRESTKIRRNIAETLIAITIGFVFWYLIYDGFNPRSIGVLIISFIIVCVFVLLWVGPPYVDD